MRTIVSLSPTSNNYATLISQHNEHIYDLTNQARSIEGLVMWVDPKSFTTIYDFNVVGDPTGKSMVVAQRRHIRELEYHIIKLKDVVLDNSTLRDCPQCGLIESQFLGGDRVSFDIMSGDLCTKCHTTKCSLLLDV